MEKERKINWFGLFIKIIIIFIFVLLIIWLLSKIISKSKLSDTFKTNIANMEEVATNYFKGVDLPLEKGKSLKISLGEMIDKGLIVSINENDSTTCNAEKSFSKITRKKSNYILSTTLNCGNEKNTITKKFPLSDCKNCSEGKKNKEKSSNGKNSSVEDKNSQKNSIDNTTNNNDIQNENAKNLQTYYEYVKEEKTYTKWIKGNITGDNVENKFEYYSVSNDTYYSVGVIKENDFKLGNTINYTLKISRVPNKNYYFSSIIDSSYFSNNDEIKYRNEKGVHLRNENYNIAKNISSYSLTENNFAYRLSPYYRKGEFYVDVEVTITNTNGVESYKEKNSNIYFVPLKLNIKYASDNITTTIPSTEYETITYYRYVEIHKDIIWSTENYVEGYTKTGNSEQR